jgi:hypothetical protein
MRRWEGGMNNEMIKLIEKFCGQTPEPHQYIMFIDDHPSFPSAGMGHSQLNELLLSLHLDRTGPGFFDYVFKGDVIPDIETFEACINRFRAAAILNYGNIKFAFKRLSQMSKQDIEHEVGNATPNQIRDSFTRTNRH